MKKFFPALFILFSAANLFAQLNASIDIVGGISSTFRTIDGGGNNTEVVRNDLELNKSNLHVGFNFNLLVTNKVHFKTGIRYLSLGYKTRNQSLDFPGMPSINIFFTYDYQFIEVPLVLRYELVEQKTFSPFFELGLTPMYLFGNKQVQYQGDDIRVTMRRPISSEFNALHLALNGNVGMNYFLPGGGTGIFIQGLFRYDLTNLTDSDNFKEFLYGYGLEIGVRRSVASEF